MRQIISTAVILAFVFAHGQARAQGIPQMIPYTGTVTVRGVPFNGSGQFKFAIVNGHVDCQVDPPGANCKAFWYNENATPISDQAIVPTRMVPLVVTNGIFSVKLGDTTLPNMAALPTAIFNNTQTFLRVWFNDGVAGFQHLAPDRQLVSVPYAYRADVADKVPGLGNAGTLNVTGNPVDWTQLKNVPAGLADGVDDGVLGPASDVVCTGCINTTDIADGAIDTGDLAFSPATQAELNSHKGSGDHDSRYVLKSGDTLTGQLTLPSNGLVVGTNQLVISNGNVGIGTTTPKATLHVIGSIMAQGGTAYFGQIANINANPANESGGGIAISDDGGFFDLNDGFVTYKNLCCSGGLRVNANLTVNTSSAHLLLGRGSSETTGGKVVFLDLLQNDSSPLQVPEVYPIIRFHHAGRFWVRIEAGNSGFHFKTGDMRYDTYVPLYASAFSVSSSGKMKMNVTDSTYGLSEILKLQAKNFKYINDPTYKEHIGFIAEDIDNVLPEIVQHDSDGQAVGIDYGKLSVVLVNAIKEQQKEIESLKAALEYKGQQGSLNDGE